jgi:hypothetical protein
MALLVDADTPHAKDLAPVVAGRLLAIAESDTPEVMTDEQLAEWIDLARNLAGSYRPKGTLLG